MTPATARMAENKESRIHRLLFRLWLSLWPLFLGLCLPYVDFAGQHYLNLPWSFAFGLGLQGQEAVFGWGITSPYNPFGILLWPIMVTAFLYWLSGKLWKALQPSHRLILAALFFISGIFIANLRSPLSGIIPTYWWLMYEIW
jgi:phosphoglycerol transferase MdoB-like AlkP superfamily enzyme